MKKFLLAALFMLALGSSMNQTIAQPPLPECYPCPPKPTQPPPAITDVLILAE